jgi:hypothetical protein
VDVLFALKQIAGRQAIEHKIPSWYAVDELIFPLSLSLEQASSEATAQYKASLVQGDSMIDLTGGFGVDCAFLSGRFDTVVYVEAQAELCEIARYNFSLLKKDNIRVVCSDAVSYLKKTKPVHCIYLDPARRSKAGRKTVFISDCEPDAGLIKPDLLEKAATVMIKLSPMLDIALALQMFPETKSVHVVSVGNECKELLFVLKKGHPEEAAIHCVNLYPKKAENQLFSFLRSEEKESPASYTSVVESYLYEPNASLLKAGAYKSVAHAYGLGKLHPDSHLYTSENYIPDFPGRIFHVLFVSSFNKPELKAKLCHVDTAHIAVRNFPDTVNRLRQKLQLKEGGDLYLFATTLYNGKKVLIGGVKKSGTLKD